ncbi:aminoglycoside phosphotransferase family protein [Streptomyces avermitilis]|uniref:Hydroxyurea phosphotransferase n=1 Tax=Streptomyces avermitilis (strain ATCC 31267 / DSM 46492 / JCM 5070 / NBRC 14893 / NCIMB 12804 / NRRL 8165 / MA-4680) TaxID=227882 RepID=Q82GD6_STRAW|nr:aminoglycoside phosphotransferase family protein [Streptomyces sp. SID5469]MYS99555.1 hydroxyurea phosphotransferase [Streptomyces sp. SID5469]BAC71673.1 putative hydroxyurea phosphotransferase [Streptomyces avermitilis MA-4680 = NBRC 14893]
MVGRVIDVPEELAASQQKFNGAAGRAFIAGLPRRAADFLERWELRVDGPSMYGVCALVLPVLRADGTPAALKLQPLDEESAGEPLALRRWDGAGAVRLLEHDEATCTLLLERLDEARSLAETPDTREAVLVVARLLARLTALPAPEGMRRLGDIAAAMLEQVPWAVRQLADPGDRRLVEDCAAAVREVAAEPGDRLLHWDLHFDNVLASHRAPWLAIDPKPLAGDPGFDLLPAIRNRFEPAEIRWRFDAMTEILGLDRERARAWSLARVLQNTLWDLADGRPLEAAQREIGRQLRER